MPSNSDPLTALAVDTHEAPGELPAQGHLSRVLLVAEDSMVRESLAKALAGEADLDVVECSGRDGPSYVNWYAPNVVLLEYCVGSNLAQPVLAAAQQCATCNGVLITADWVSHVDQGRLRKLGVAGIVLKRESLSNLVDAIHRVAAGGTGCQQPARQAPPTVTRQFHESTPVAEDQAKNRRQKTRFDLRLPFSIRGCGKSRLRLTGHTINVSSKGALFDTERRVQVGKRILFSIVLCENDEQTTIIDGVAKVVRTVNTGFGYGVAASVERSRFVRMPRY